jgi:hypothetical protein
MKSILAVLAFLALGLSSQAQTKIGTTWTNANQTQAVCDSTVTPPIASACTGLQTLTLQLVGSTAPPTVISSTIAAKANAFTITPLPAKGTYTISVTQSFLDFGGAAQVTPATTTTVVVPDPFIVYPPTGLKGIVQ